MLYSKYFSFFKRNAFVFFLSSAAALYSDSGSSEATYSTEKKKAEDVSDKSEEFVKEKHIKTFSPFTGKVTRNKVRLRLQPSLDSLVVRELNKSDMLVIVGEQDEFYAIQPPQEIKGYVYRTYVLDNVIEGSKVNVRLAPNTEAAVVAQLNGGDYIQGAISPLNSKWYEIAIPSSAHLWICKEYIDKIGPPTLIAQMERRRGEANDLLNSTYLAAQHEMAQPFQEINLQPVLDGFSRLINEYKDFPEQSGRAREMISHLQEEYLNKKVAYLESKAIASSKQPADKDQETDQEQAPSFSLMEEKAFLAAANREQAVKKEPPACMALWIPNEEAMMNSWREQDPSLTWNDFYREQESQAIEIQGVIQPYERAVKNKPGDFLLVSQVNKQPIGYIYSTLVDLSHYLNQTVTLRVVPRPNNNFAFPAYVVLSVQ